MKTIQPALYCLLFLFSFSCTSKKEITRLNHTTVKPFELTSRVQHLVDSAEVHGLGLSIFNNNKLIYQNTFGFKNFETKESFTDSTNLYGASLSKAVFGVLIMQLVEEGILALDTPLQNYLPKPIYTYTPLTRWHDNFLDLASDSLYHKITARMCLNHTSGFPNWRWYMADKKLRVLAEPGSRYRYSGEGFVYLQVILEKLLGKSLEELAQERIFRPLGMKNSSYTWQPAFENNFAYGHARTGALFSKDKDNEARAASTLETTLADYSLFMEAILQQKLLMPSSYKELLRSTVRVRSHRQFGPLAEKDSHLNDSIQLGYGMGWGILESPHGIGAFKEGHGEGFQHYSVLYPEVGIGVLIMTNSDNGEGIFKELLSATIADTFSPTEWNNYIPYQQVRPVPDSLYGYQCAPCKMDCDTLSYQKSGLCPNCKRRLVPKISATSTY